MKRKNNQISILDRVILTTIKLIIFFVISILIYHKIARTLGYNVSLIETPDEGKYVTYVYVKKGYKIYSIQHEEDFDIESYKENLKKYGFIED